MFLFYVLWIVVVIGGFYMGIGYALGAYQHNYDISMILNAVVYLGCAFFGLPKFLKLLASNFKKS